MPFLYFLLTTRALEFSLRCHIPEVRRLRIHVEILCADSRRDLELPHVCSKPLSSQDSERRAILKAVREAPMALCINTCIQEGFCTSAVISSNFDYTNVCQEVGNSCSLFTQPTQK